MYCWHLLLLTILWLTSPSTSERFNGRQCCEHEDFSDTRLLSYRRLRDKPADDRRSIRGPDIRNSRWRDDKNRSAFRRISEEKSTESNNRNFVERRTTEHVAHDFNRFDTREKRYIRRDDARNTLQRNDGRVRNTARRFEFGNGQFRRMERNPFDKKTERQTNRENMERPQIRSRFESRQDNRYDVHRSREFKDIDDNRRVSKRENIRKSNLESFREIRAVRDFDDNIRTKLQSDERMTRDSRTFHLSTEHRDTILDRRSSLDPDVTRRLSPSPTLTRDRISVANNKDGHEREIRRSLIYRGVQTDRQFSSLPTNIRTSRFQEQRRFSKERDARRITDHISTRSVERSENLSRELRKIELDENRRFARSIPQSDRRYDNARRILSTPTRLIETESRISKEEFRPSHERDHTRRDRTRTEHRMSTESQSTLRRDDQRFSLTPSELNETRRIKLERYVSERRNNPSEANSHRNLAVRRQLSRFSIERRFSTSKREIRQYNTERLSERFDTRLRHVARTVADDNESRFSVNRRYSREVSDVYGTRTNVERTMELRRQRSNTRQERDHLSRDSTERGNRRYATDSRLVRYENDARLSANTIYRENRKLSLSMDRVDMRDRRNPQARINVRRSMESKARFVAERPETRRHQEEQSSRLDVSRLRSLSDLEARVSRRIDNTVRSTNLQRTRMTREIQYRRSIEQNMESRVFREREHSRRSLHREVAYAPDEIRSVRHSSERIFVARDLQQNERHERELSRNLNTERMNVRRNFNELSQRTSDRIGNDRIVRDMSRFDERRNVKSGLTSYPTEQRENRRNDERRFMRNENRLRDVQSRDNIRQQHSMSDVTQRARIIRELSEQIRKSADQGIIRSVSERGIPGGRISEIGRTNNRDSIVRKTSERVKSTEKRQDLRTVRRNERDLSRSIRLDLRQNDLKSINRQVRSYRVDTDSRSKLEGQLNNILTLGTNDKRNAMDNDQRKEDGSYILNWQHFFYIIQGLYLCSVLLHVHINDTKSKIKSRNFGWWKSMYGFKLD